MAVIEVRVSLPAGERRVHRFQVVRETRADGRQEDWIVVGFTAEEIELASIGFDWSRTIPVAAIEDGPFEPLAAGDVPVWGY